MFHVTSIDLEEKDNFTKFIKECKINFAWTYVDMPGLDLALVVQHLILFLGVKPINKNLLKMLPQVALLVKVELQKKLYVNFIRPIAYLEWVCNLVSVSKPLGPYKFLMTSYTSTRHA
jgi:hypothetical protein